MFFNYLKIFLRKLARNKVYAMINIAGLALGMACTILLLLWVEDETSFDNSHQNGANLYRVLYEWKSETGKFATSPGLLAPEAKRVIPEVANAGRMLIRPKMLFKAIDPNATGTPKSFYEDKYYLVDPEFFEMFTLPFIYGDPKTALDNGVVITEEIAVKYFGTVDALGKRVNVNNWFDAEITGVIKNIPANSHFNFKIFGRLESLKRFFPGGFTWANCIHQTYMHLTPGADVAVVSQKLTQLNKSNSESVAGNLRKIHLQPLRDVYLAPEIVGGTARQGDIRYVYIFTLIAFAILLIGCINFVNLTTAQAATRVREVGLRKVIGANRQCLIRQFWGESFFMAFIAALVSILLVEIVLPTFNNFIGKYLAFEYFNPTQITGFFLLIGATGLLAGAWPALYFSNFKPIQILKNKWVHSKSSGLRQGLVVVQFSITVFFIIITLILSGQLDFMRNRKLGFKKENVICLPVKANIGRQYLSFKNALLQHADIQGVTIKNSLTTEAINYANVWWEEKQSLDILTSEIAEVDYDFVKTLNLEIIAGRDFSKEHVTDLKQAFIINEAAAKQMNLKPAVGTRMNAWGKDGTIIGVVNNANFKPLKYAVQPIVFHLTDNFADDVMDLFGVVFISVKSGDITNTIKTIENTWDKFNPGYQFDYYFLDETYHLLYESEQRLSRIFSVFTFLAILITCLGLFGLALFMTEQRTKEIGIRKVLGASVLHILSMLTGSFAKWVLVANIIAWPIAGFIMHQWLQNYAYHTNLSPWTFLFAGALALLICLLTVSYLTVRVATANPVESLKYE